MRQARSLILLITFGENLARLGSLKKFRVYLRPDQNGGTAGRQNHSNYWNSR